MISRIKGTRDRCDLRLYNDMCDRIVSHLTRYAFSEIATPILEPVELFQQSLGLQTDVVTKEMYVVHTGRDETDICLRPEATASTMRAYYNNGIQAQPWKVFSRGPMFRHERPQKGRYRQFDQCNLEIINAASITYDAQLIMLLDRLFQHTLRLHNYALCINFLGEPEERKAYIEHLRAYLEKQPELPQPLKERKDANILRTFDLKDPDSQAIMANAPSITDHLSETSQQEWQQLKQMLDQLSVSYTCDPTLVRGLDYYNKTVFEFLTPDLGAQKTFCGGGRYDYLSQALGERDAIPALGAAIGLERLELLLEQHQERYPRVLPEQTRSVIAPLSQDQHVLALICADMLHTHHIETDIICESASVKSMLRKANKRNARFVLMIGDDEQHNNYIRVKDMHTGTQEDVPQGRIVAYLKERFTHQSA